jgi:glycosyltransferase involved in cell wall biosynthesis
MKTPLISIITVTFNAEKYLVDTISSVANQTYKNIEHIIVDGGSTDLTLQIIKKYKDEISTWVSEPDKGISDAMNKGISLSTGEYIIFLHADDYFFNNDVINRAVKHLEKNTHIYLFKVKLVSDKYSTFSNNQNLGFFTNLKMGSCHQGQICSQKLFQDIGTFSTDLKITMDYDFILRAYRAGYQSTSVDMILSTMRLIGISSQSDWSSLKKRFKEEKRVHSINTQNIWHKLLYKIYWPLYILYRKIFYMIKL